MTSAARTGARAATPAVLLVGASYLLALRYLRYHR
jgi:hypothetical protein